MSLKPHSNPLQDLARLLDQQVQAGDSHSDYIINPLDDIFEEIPVTLPVFLYGKRYLALPQFSQKQYDFIEAGTQLYFPNTLADLKWKPLPYYTMLVAKWGKGSGKDTVSRLILARLAYLLMVLRDPQKYLNMVPGDSINMLNVAYSANQAQVIFFEPLKRMLDKALWFRGKFNATENVLKFNKDINLYSGHSEQESLEGHNLLAAVLDEIAAFKTKAELEQRQRRSVRALEHSAEALADMVTSSATSRFPYIHKIIYISYTRFKGDFIEQKYEEALTRPLTAFASFGATWEVNPTKKREMFDAEYQKNPENARARYECDPPEAVDSFFKQLTPELIADVFPVIPEIENPITFSETNPLLKLWWKGQPGVNYFAHIDLAVSKDRAGICICHRAGFDTIDIRRIDPLGRVYFEPIRLPRVKVDIWFSWLAPPSGEVSLEGVREFVLNLHENRDCKFAVVTFDKYQSADSIQLLTKRGILADLLSVDRDTKAYDTLKDFIYTRRLEAYYREIGVRELKRLNIITGNKVDHPLIGSKDEADSLAGAVYNASVAEQADTDENDIGSAGIYDEIFSDYHMDKQSGVWTQEMLENRIKY